MVRITNSRVIFSTNLSRLIQFIMTKALPYMFASFGYGTWFFFACWMLIASTWAFFLLPETKGVTIDQMDILLYVLALKPHSE